ncbi:MAG TPA: hypothetical protein VF665_15590 [Longimicrobium sp.]|jgi:hypothetical protein|uniref:hypothetical protein n=1 Tax=Longimicrobium sp. TaxID=2029185 RepID=UPI002ED9A349
MTPLPADGTSERRELRRAKVFAAYEQAAADAEYMSDVRTIMDAFEPAVADGLGRVDET